MASTVEAVIGLEVHVELSTRSKLFCGCPVTFGEAPNTRICPVCTGQPGVLPALNRAAVERAVRTALALGCRVRRRSRFARKHYFYPDLPKGYQISQYEEPLAEGGALAIGEGEGSGTVAIERLHLEEEAGRLLHPTGGRVSLVDYNRAGIPLLEIVTRPEIAAPEDAVRFLRRLRRLLLHLGVSDCRMEEGSLRCDANVSVRPRGSEALGVKTELKNMNSFRELGRAMAWEIDRQAGLVRAGGRVQPDTLLWDPARGEAVVMRGKEEAEDYRYFPDPDLPPLVLDEPWIEELRAGLPEGPGVREARFLREYGLTARDARLILADPGLADYYGAVVGVGGEAGAAARWRAGVVRARLRSEGIGIESLKVRPVHLASLLSMIEAGTIGGPAARRVFHAAADTGRHPAEIVESEGLFRIEDPDAIAGAIERVLAENPEVVEKYRRGKESVIEYLVGRVMGETRGRVDPSAVRERLRAALSRYFPQSRG
jgi:aspartyl-tRNA(Asn)/glutamyl-tRNA(Gln) amidotransferase subunit B